MTFRTRITNYKLKDGKLIPAPVRRSVSQRIRAMKSTRVKVKRKGTLR
jgi:hypothetical protein